MFNLLFSIVLLYDTIVQYVISLKHAFIKKNISTISKIFSSDNIHNIDNIQINTHDATREGLFIISWLCKYGFDVIFFSQFFENAKVIYIDYIKDGVKKQKKIIIDNNLAYYEYKCKTLERIAFNIVNLD